MKLDPLQSSFSGGEVSPRFYGKTDTEFYRTGMRLIENMEVTPQGTLKSRDGFQHIGATGETTGSIHTFKRGVNDDAVVVIGDNNVTVWNRGGIVQQAPSPELVVDPTFLQGFTFWTENNTAGGFSTAVPGVGVDQLISSGPDDSVIEISQIIPIAEPTHAHAYNFFVSNFVDDAGSTVEWRIQVVETGNESNVIKSIARFNPPPSGTQGFSGTFVPNVASVKLKIFILKQGGGNINPDPQWRVSQISIKDTEFVGGNVQFALPASWVGKQKQIQTAMDAALGQMFFTVEDGEVWRMTYDKLTFVWDFDSFVPTGQDWADDYPGTCAIHQSRLYLGGSLEQPSTIWASKPFDYDDFTQGTNPDDGMKFQLSTAGKIQWLRGLKLLLIGTDLGQYVGSSQGPAITPTDFQFTLQQSWGADYYESEPIGNEVMFIGSDQKKIRSMFDGGDITNSYQSVEVSLVAEHLFRLGICDIEYSQNPSYLLFALQLTGSIVGGTYFKPIDINGWFRYTTEGSVASIATTDDNSGQSLWILVDRGFGEMYLEVKDAQTEKPNILDSWVSREAVGTTVSDLDHLEGRLVYPVLVEDNDEGIEVQQSYTLHPPRVVVGGEIQLEYFGENFPDVIVGLLYEQKATTLELADGNPIGTAKVQKRRNAQIYLELIESSLPLINEDRAAVRTPDTPMTTSQPLYSGLSKSYDVGFNEGIIEVVQDKPLPMHISAIFSKARGEST